LSSPHALNTVRCALQGKFYVDKNVLKGEAGDAGKAPSKQKKKTGSFKDTLATLQESPKIMNLALLVVCYAIAHRLFEFAWKGQLRVLFPTTQAYSGALADVSILTGTSWFCGIWYNPEKVCCIWHNSGKRVLASA
jgi:ATP/ADP translocase